MIRFHFGGESLGSTPPDDGGEWVVGAYARGVQASLLAVATAASMAFAASAQAQPVQDEVPSTPPVGLESTALVPEVSPATRSMRYWFAGDELAIAAPALDDSEPAVAPIVWPTPRVPLAVAVDDEITPQPSIVAEDTLALARPVVWPQSPAAPATSADDVLPSAPAAGSALESTGVTPIVAPSSRSIRFFGSGDEIPTITPALDDTSWTPPRPQRNDDVVSLFIADEDLQPIALDDDAGIPRIVWPAHVAPRAIALSEELPTSAPAAIDEAAWTPRRPWPTAAVPSAFTDDPALPSIIDDDAWAPWPVSLAQRAQRVVAAFQDAEQLVPGAATAALDDDAYLAPRPWMSRHNIRANAWDVFGGQNASPVDVGGAAIGKYAAEHASVYADLSAVESFDADHAGVYSDLLDA
jgi:hypothetical protein